MKAYKLLVSAAAMFAISNVAFAAVGGAYTSPGFDANDAKTYTAKCQLTGKDNTTVMVMTANQAACENINGTVVTLNGNGTSTNGTTTNGTTTNGTTTNGN